MIAALSLVSASVSSRSSAAASSCTSFNRCLTRSSFDEALSRAKPTCSTSSVSSASTIKRELRNRRHRKSGPLRTRARRVDPMPPDKLPRRKPEG
jgi:hypothetical protein